MRKFAEEMMENECRIGHIIHINSALMYYQDTGGFPEEFQEAMEEIFDRDFNNAATVVPLAVQDIPGLLEWAKHHAFVNDTRWPEDADLSEFLFLQRISGYLVKYVRCVPEFNKNGHYSYSWGYTTSEWAYFSELDEEGIFGGLVSWAQDVYARELNHQIPEKNGTV